MQERFRKIGYAYFILSDIERRNEYNISGQSSTKLTSFSKTLADTLYDTIVHNQDLNQGTENSDAKPQVWSTYESQSLTIGGPHPGQIVEASVLAGVRLPANNYPIEDSLGKQIRWKLLSRMQLEGIAYAAQRHLQFINENVRAGFYLGDSAGVGKGRQLSGIIFDNLVRGRRKHCWFSVSTDL